MLGRMRLGLSLRQVTSRVNCTGTEIGKDIASWCIENWCICQSDSMKNFERQFEGVPLDYVQYHGDETPEFIREQSASID